MQLAVIRHVISDFLTAGVRDVRLMARAAQVELEMLYKRPITHPERLEAAVKDELTMTAVRGFVIGLRDIVGVANAHYELVLLPLEDGWFWCISDEGALVASGHVFDRDERTARAIAGLELARRRFDDPPPGPTLTIVPETPTELIPEKQR